MVRLVAIVAMMLTALMVSAEAASAQTASRVIRLIDQRCANCHRNADADRPPDVEGAPEPATLRRMAPETILQAITTGAMRVHAEGIPDQVKRAMAEYLSGRKLGALGAGDARNMPNRCSTRSPLTDVSGSTAWNGWGPDATNRRFQRAAGLSAADLPRLTLKWAFGFPGVSSVYGQPTVSGGRVFVGVDTGYV